MADERQYSRPDNKRKFDDPSPPPPPSSYGIAPNAADPIQLAKQRAQEIASKLLSDAEAKRPKVDNGSDNDDYQKPLGQTYSSQIGNTQPTSYAPYGYGSSKKIDIPNGRVGVIIGKQGETIKNLQLQSGAKIQVTRDNEANPNSQTRSVELTGTPEQISRAEQMILDVLEGAELSGSSMSGARKFGGSQYGSQFVMKVPNNKVGLIIGKGGETIKNMQANTGAKIQVIPLHLPPGDTSTERTLQMNGTEEQLEAAKKLVNDIITGENRARNPQMSGGYSQQGYRPPQPASWGPPGGPPPMQQPGYGYMQPGAYPGPAPQYSMPQPAYGSNPQPAASGWDQTFGQPTQQTTQPTGYDYYNQQQPQQPPTTAPADNTGYNYGQPAPVYNSQGTYGDASQTYGQAIYNNNAQPPQTGYSQTTPVPQTGYDQYGGSAANPTQDGSASSYGAPLPVQPSPTQQGYTSQPPSTAPTSYPPQTGYGPLPTSQPGYGQPPNLSQSGYGQSPQGQKPPATYGSSQTGYAPQSQLPPPPVQSGYGQQYQQVPPAAYGGAPPAAPPSQAGYGQQTGYGDSYGAYSQPPPVYGGSEGGAAPAGPGGVTKASPQS